ncbi:MAG TPA: thiolase domain-containing protein [Anaerolineales bacterium]|nr:thiolase domain-containing protein [Anaerolineales bacterium]
MTEVVIAGIGQTPVGEHWDISLRELALQAIELAQTDAGGLQPQALYVANMLSTPLSQQAHLGALIADFAGLNGIEAATIEAAGASGGAALRVGYLAVASGQVDAAMVVGVEKFTDQLGSSVDAALSATGDSDYEAVQGLTPTAQAALLMRRYLHEFEAPRQAFSGLPVIAHANGASNPNAMFQKAISAETYARAGLVSDPLNMFDVAPLADGAAAVLLTRPELLPPGFPHSLVRVAGSSLVTDTLALHDRPDPLTFHAARLSVERACQQAGVRPDQLDFFELFDAYTIYAVLSLEAAGLAGRGQGWQLAQDGQLALNGALPVATFGGLKARGNPGGATGLYQVVEAVLQLRGQAGRNQVPGARWAMAQALGGPASSAATHILERRD